MHVVATAGHVDHGKSTLVLTLTGTDPDRWAEEKQRGLTIDLGFAHATLPSGAEVSFVDVPGHVRFLKNMLAGVGAVDACLFVVAATEGWKPQSEEHLRILELLGARHGLVAMTKVGLVDEEWAELARMDIVDRVAGTFLEGAPIIGVDALIGEGVAELRGALDTLLASTPTATDRARPRLWVDRSFAAKGAGTIITGTLASGALHEGDEVHVIGEGGVRRARVRGLQVHGAGRTNVAPGNRVAVNLSGIDHGDVVRGDAVITPDRWHLTTRFDASLRTLEALDHEVSRRGAFAAYVGSGEHAVRVRIIGPQTISPGADGLVRIHLATALPLVPGDRFVLRDHGREETIGGGEVLDVEPIRPASKAQPDRRVERVVAERGWVDTTKLELLTGEPYRGPVVAGRWVVDPAALGTRRDRLVARIDGAGQLGLDLAVLDERDRAVLAVLGDLGVDGIVVEQGRVRREDTPDPLADHPFVRALESAPFRPPDATGMDRNEVRELVRKGLVVERDGVWFAPAAIAEAARRVAVLLSTNPSGVTVAQVRDEFDTTRKHVLPLLAHLDATGVTRRREDLRIAGPRLPTLG